MGYGVICAEYGSLWDIRSSTVDNPLPCDGSDFDYVTTILEDIRNQPDVFDKDRIFLSGYSHGSAAATYIALCYPDLVRGVGLLGSGLHFNGEGVTEELCDQ